MCEAPSSKRLKASLSCFPGTQVNSMDNTQPLGTVVLVLYNSDSSSQTVYKGSWKGWVPMLISSSSQAVLHPKMLPPQFAHQLKSIIGLCYIKISLLHEVLREFTHFSHSFWSIFSLILNTASGFCLFDSCVKVLYTYHTPWKQETKVFCIPFPKYSSWSWTYHILLINTCWIKFNGP